MPKFVSLISFAVVASGMLTAAADAQLAEKQESTRDYLEQMQEYYETTFPDFKPETVKSTGFKPFQRYKAFIEPRLGEANDMVPGARMEAFKRLQRLEEEAGYRGLPTWFNLGPTNFAGRCLAIAVHPNDSDTAFAGFASGGLWLTENGGTTWTPIGDYLPTLAVSCIEIDYDDPDHMWIGTGEGWGNVDAMHGVGILESHDGGITFETTGYSYALGSARDVFELEYNETNGTLMAAADNGLWRSTDDGDTWTEVMELGLWKDVELKLGTSDTYFACAHQMAGAGIYKSTDDGVTWNQVTSGLPTTTIGNCRLAQTPGDTNRMYWAVANSSGGNSKGIWRSTDGGNNWSQVTSANHYNGQGWYNLSIGVDPQDPDVVYSGGVQFYRSTNGGSAWSTWAGNVHVDHHAIAYDPSNTEVMWIGSDGGCYRSTNGGSSFASRNSGLVTSQFYAMNHSFPDLNRAAGGTQDNGTWRYAGTTSWGSILGGDGFECEIGSNNDDIVWAELYYGDHRKSTTGGGGMIPRNSGISESGPWQTPTHMDYDDDNRLYTGHSSKIFRTTNGTNWTAPTMSTTLGGGRAIAQCYTDVDHLVTVGGTRVFVSTDRGATWNDTPNPAVANSISDVAMHPTNPDIMLLCTATYSSGIGRVFKTTDGGANWTDISVSNGLAGEGANTVIFDFDNPDWYYLGTDLGVFVSFNAGGSWAPLNVGLPHVICSDLRWHPAGYLRVSTHGRGIWELDISGLEPVDVTEGPSSGTIAPLTMRIDGNPSDRPTVRFGIREAGHVDIELFDATGRKVQSVFSGEQEARVDFVEIDSSGLSSGVYFAKMSAHGEQLTKKLVIEK